MDKTPKRPKNVPFGARWAAPLWHYGTVDASGAAQGLWCGWRKNGVLAFVAHLKDDLVTGPSVEFHPDGALSRRAVHINGKTVGIEEFFAPQKKSDEPFPAKKPVTKVVVDHARARTDNEGHTHYFLESGAECNEHGTPLSALVNDAPFVVHDSEAFLTKGLAAYVKHRIKMAPSASAKAKGAPEPGLTRAIGSLWGIKPRGPLKVALASLERAKLPKHLGELRTEPAATLAALGAGATAESIVTRGQRSVGALPLIALLSGLIPFATEREGAVFALSVHDDDECAVYALDASSDLRQLQLESDDFATFVLAQAATEATGAKMLSPRAHAHLAKLLSGHVELGSLGAIALAKTRFDEGETQAQRRHRRAAWLVALLSARPLDEVRRVWREAESAPLDRALVARLDRPASFTAPDLVYAMMRGFFASDARLPTLLGFAERSRSELVTSTAALVRALEQGRPRLGALRDVRAVRAAVASMVR